MFLAWGLTDLNHNIYSLEGSRQQLKKQIMMFSHNWGGLVMSKNILENSSS